MYCLEGTTFLKFINTSGKIKTIDYVLSFMYFVVDEIGEDNIVQIVTNYKPLYKIVGKKLKRR